MRFDTLSNRPTRRLRILSAFTLVAIATFTAGHASAIAPACGWSTTTPIGPLTNVALDAPIRINAIIYDSCWSGDPLVAVTATVTDGTETVSGSLGYNSVLGALYWLTDAPFAPNTSYALTAVFDNNVMGDWYMPSPSDVVIAFETGAATLEAPTAAQVSTSVLTEQRNSDTECCYAGYECSYRVVDCGYCWANSYSYVPAVDITFVATAASNIYYHQIAKGSSASSLVGITSLLNRGSDPMTVQVVFDSGVFPACVRVDTLSIVDDSVVAQGEVICHDEADLEPLEREDVPTPDFDQCEDPGAYETHPLNPLNPTASGNGAEAGCSAGGSGVPSHVYLVLGILGLMIIRRR